MSMEGMMTRHYWIISYNRPVSTNKDAFTPETEDSDMEALIYYKVKLIFIDDIEMKTSPCFKWILETTCSMSEQTTTPGLPFLQRLGTQSRKPSIQELEPAETLPGVSKIKGGGSASSAPLSQSSRWDTTSPIFISYGYVLLLYFLMFVLAC